MKIANIVYEGELVNHKRVEYVNYYDKATKYGDLDTSLPTLYVGWSLMRTINKGDELFDKADILKHRMISDLLYWEFSFAESKPSHVKGIESFIKYVPLFYFSSNYTYTDLDPVFFQISNIQDLFDVLPKEIDRALYSTGEMLYLLKDNKITGLNMKLYKFFKFNGAEIVLHIQERCSDFHDDIKGDVLMKLTKIFPNFPQLKRYLITLLTK
jgi:hypothetical protein